MHCNIFGAIFTLFLRKVPWKALKSLDIFLNLYENYFTQYPDIPFILVKNLDSHIFFFRSPIFWPIKWTKRAPQRHYPQIFLEQVSSVHGTPWFYCAISGTFTHSPRIQRILWPRNPLVSLRKNISSVHATPPLSLRFYGSERKLPSKNLHAQHLTLA